MEKDYNFIIHILKSFKILHVFPNITYNFIGLFILLRTFFNDNLDLT